ncbi:MAG: ATP-binding cassette domain-containing protein [Ferruginibacter sp.]
MLQLSAVQKFYNKDLILDIPQLHLESGIYWVKGANGSGKTTLLKMIAGLIPFKGDISFKNTSLQNDPLAYRQMVSWAEAEPLFPLFMTGMELVCLYGSIRNISKKDIAELLEIFSLHDYVNNSIGTYSAGMTKKLSLVLAFIGNTSLIVLDEPLITLDPYAFTAACKFILERFKNTGTAFLMSSHQDLDTELTLSGKEITVINRSVLIK